MSVAVAAAQRWPWVNSGHDSQERRRCGISVAPHHLHTVFTQNFCFIENKDFITSYGQSNDAAPTVLLFWSVAFNPSESLRDPKGLRICRPDTGLDSLLNQ